MRRELHNLEALAAALAAIPIQSHEPIDLAEVSRAAARVQMDGYLIESLASLRSEVEALAYLRERPDEGVPDLEGLRAARDQASRAVQDLRSRITA